MMYEDTGNEKTLEDILSTSTIANMLRLKVILLSFTRTLSEYKIIGFLCDGYRKSDIEELLKVSRQWVEKVVRTYRKRLTAEQIENIFSILKED